MQQHQVQPPTAHRSNGRERVKKMTQRVEGRCRRDRRGVVHVRSGSEDKSWSWGERGRGRGRGQGARCSCRAARSRVRLHRTHSAGGEGEREGRRRRGRGRRSTAHENKRRAHRTTPRAPKGPSSRNPALWEETSGAPRRESGHTGGEWQVPKEQRQANTRKEKNDIMKKHKKRSAERGKALQHGGGKARGRTGETNPTHLPISLYTANGLSSGKEGGVGPEARRERAEGASTRRRQESAHLLYDWGGEKGEKRERCGSSTATCKQRRAKQ